MVSEIVPMRKRIWEWGWTLAVAAAALAIHHHYDAFTHDEHRLVPEGEGRSQALLVLPSGDGPAVEDLPAHHAQRLLVPGLVRLWKERAIRRALPCPEELRFDRPYPWDSPENDVYRKIRGSYRDINRACFVLTTVVAFFIARAAGGALWQCAFLAVLLAMLPASGRIYQAWPLSPVPTALCLSFAGVLAVLKGRFGTAALMGAVGGLAHENALLVSVLIAGRLLSGAEGKGRGWSRALGWGGVPFAVYLLFLFWGHEGGIGRVLRVAAGIAGDWRGGFTEPGVALLRLLSAPWSVFAGLLYLWALHPWTTVSSLRRHAWWVPFLCAVWMRAGTADRYLIFAAPAVVWVATEALDWSVRKDRAPLRLVSFRMVLFALAHLCMTGFLVNGAWIEQRIVPEMLTEIQTSFQVLGNLELHVIWMGGIYFLSFSAGMDVERRLSRA